MNGLARTLVAASLGAVAALALPRVGLLAATQELIGFLSLLMAGLLPAMTLTATILRGEGISAKRVDEYACALRLQLRFWAALFATAAIATLAIVLAKIFSTTGVAVAFEVRGVTIDQADLVAAAVAVMGMSLGVVVQRLSKSYAGLKSLLDLNANMARADALSRDRSFRDALSNDVGTVENPSEYAATGR